MAISYRLTRAALVLAALAACLSIAHAAASEEQKQALLLLRGAVDREGVLKASWDPSQDACTWEGITCDAASKVTGINLDGKGVTGQLPLDSQLWTDLASVKNANFANNNVDGYLPPQMSAVTDLEYLSLRGNQMKSPLPTSWAGLGNLKGLDLGSNELFGDLPESWADLSALQSLDLSANKFTGKIPEQWKTLPNLEAASLAGNAGLCASNADATGPATFFGPCTEESPVLPNINPDYAPSAVPPAVAPSPEAKIPSPAPAPRPTVVPVPAPEVVPVPAPAPKVVPVPAPAPEVAPAPAPGPVAPVKPTTSTEMDFQVSGITQATFNKNQAAYKTVMGKAGGVQPDWVSVDAAPVTDSSSTSGRRLLAEPAGAVVSANAPPLFIKNTLFASDTAAVQSSLEAAVADGSLARQLSALGMTLDESSITYPSAAPSDSSGSNTGAIVGGVIGGVAGVALLGGAAAYAMKKRKAKAGAELPTVATGSKSGEAMYTANPAFDDKTLGDSSAVPPPAKKQSSKYENQMFAADGLDTPKGSARGPPAAEGANPMFETNQSQLSEPEAERGGYTPSDVSGALSARSRLDSARSGLRSNPMFNPTQDITKDDSDEDFGDANPVFESARSGTDIMATADSDLPLDSSRTYDTAVTGSASARGSARSAPVSNPMFGVDAAAEQGNNPMFQDQGK